MRHNLPQTLFTSSNRNAMQWESRAKFTSWRMTWVFRTCVTEFHPIRGIHFCLLDWMFKFTLALVTVEPYKVTATTFGSGPADDRQDSLSLSLSLCNPSESLHRESTQFARTSCAYVLLLHSTARVVSFFLLSLSLFTTQHQGFAPLSIRFAVQPNFLNGNCYSCHCVSSALALCLW